MKERVGEAASGNGTGRNEGEVGAGVLEGIHKIIQDKGREKLDAAKLWNPKVLFSEATRTWNLFDGGFGSSTDH